MKRCVLFLFLIMISAVVANPVIEFQHENIQNGETIFATMTTSGEFIKQIQSSDLTFYKGRKKTIFEHDIIYNNGVYYIFIYANREGEFELRIKDILYKENESLKSFDIIKPFNITTNIEIKKIDNSTNESITQILGIRPGVVYYPKNSHIKLFNKGTSVLKLKYNKEEFLLEPLSIKTIEINPEKKLSFFKVKSYKDFLIPIIYPTIEDVFISSIVKSDIRASPDFFVLELFVNIKKTSSIQIFNLGDLNITDIKITTDINFLKVGKLDDMTRREVQNLSLKIDADEPGHFQGIINITYFSGGEFSYLKVPISLYVLPKGTNKTEFKILEDSCDNMLGQVCKKPSICSKDADQRFTNDGKYCCFGECIIVKTESTKRGNYGWIIALFILAVIGGYGYYMYKKQKYISSKKSPDKIKESVEKYEKRIKVKPRITLRVKGNIQKS